MTTAMTVAIMGCVVNGPGEAKEADIGIAGGKRSGVLFKKGRIVRKVKEAEFASVLLKEIQNMAGER
jgi:(E)-4-hydroxy-3-methylbut-2-enyl-diphosphate synthase